jgi:type IV secretion system protein VirD4
MIRVSQFLCLLLGILLGLSAATQWTAHQLREAPGLGPAWFAVGTVRWYAPHAFITWSLKHASRAPAVFRVAQGLLLGGCLLGLAGAVVLRVWASREPGGPTTYGSSRWATRQEMKRAGLLGDTGVVLGQYGRRYLRHDGPEHIIGFAPTRSGKGVSWVIPTLLTYPHSVLVHDIKGENWAVTAGWRQSFSEVVYFNPTQPHSARFNPLQEVRLGANEVRDVQNIADILVDPEGANERRDHWAKTGHALLVGAILHVLYAEPDKTLAGVANFLADPARSFKATLEVMMATAHLPDGVHPVIASSARELANKSENELSGVLSTAMGFLGLYRDPVVAGTTRTCDFRIADLRHGPRPLSLYLVVPPSDLSRTKPLIRLMLNQIGRLLTASLDPGGHPLLLMLDEFPALGRLDFFESALGYLAGYGIRAFLIAQSLNQLDKAYGPHHAIFDHCHVRVAFAPNDDRTAKRIADLLGTTTELRQSRQHSGDRFGLFLDRTSISSMEVGRPLLTPGEVMQLPADEQLVFIGNTAPIRARKIRYFEDQTFLARVYEPPKRWHPPDATTAQEMA